MSPAPSTNPAEQAGATVSTAATTGTENLTCTENLLTCAWWNSSQEGARGSTPNGAGEPHTPL